MYQHIARKIAPRSKNPMSDERKHDVAWLLLGVATVGFVAVVAKGFIQVYGDRKP